MSSEFPQAGQVFEYHYLWKWQDARGETEGRKKRPSCVAVITRSLSGQTILFIAPITSKAPTKDRAAVQIPQIEARRAKLDTNLPLWVIVDELNVDVLESSFTLESRVPLGSFGAAFTDEIIRGIQQVRQAGKLAMAKRS